MERDATGQGHKTQVIVFNRGEDWESIATCSCGWRESCLSESSSAAGARASAQARAHVGAADVGPGTDAVRASATPSGVWSPVLLLAVPVLLVAGLVWYLTSDGGDGAPVAESSEPPSVSPPATATPTPTAEAPRARKRQVKTPAPADNELGLPRAVVVQLGQVADLYGYGLGPGTSLDYEQATNFAYAVSIICDDLRSGAMTLQESIDEDVVSGAPPGDARGFNRYLKGVFCPEYYAAGN